MASLLLVLTICCVVISLSIVFIAIINPSKSLAKTLLIASLVSLSCLYIDALPPSVALPDAYEVPLELISIFCIGLIWWFAQSILEDEFKLGFVQWFGMSLSVAGVLVIWSTNLLGVNLSKPFYNFLLFSWYGSTALLVVHVIWLAVNGYVNDLITDRRHIRVCIASIGMMAIVLNLAADFLIGDFEQRLLRVVVALPLNLLLMFWLLRFNGGALAFDAQQTTQPKSLGLQNQEYYFKLLQTMEQDKAYLDPELTVGSLAKLVGLPAHKLRVLINKSLGYKNFQSFVASYRIKAVKKMLSLPKCNQKSISTIAYEHGFSSIATFNRTFKNIEGVSAGQFRKSAQNANSNL